MDSVRVIETESCGAAADPSACLQQKRPPFLAEVAPARDQQIAQLDQVGSLIERRGAFAAGQPVAYYDLGSAGRTTAKVYVLITDPPEGSGLPFGFVADPIPPPAGSGFPGIHPFVFDSVPGDPRYSPFWMVHLVPVTEAYNGEVLSSVDAIADAVAQGIVAEPFPAELPLMAFLPTAPPEVMIRFYVNCPVVAEGTARESARGEGLLPTNFYYDGTVIKGFALGRAADPFGVGLEVLEERVTVPIQNVYVLRRRSEVLPLDETVRGEDLNGDGDTDDTNHIFQLPVVPDDILQPYTPLVRRVEVTVPDDYAFGAATQEADLFVRGGGGITASTPVVVDFEITDQLFNYQIAY